ncbi:phage head morphogenesis protein [Pseudomonas sp. TAE6080]|uniref:phage head morphogenesis protein n=1 Tax=Pseudomonas sp. TAE6080 TaxID=2840374 RepID=UPI001C000F40|nr:phage head morphogenesis protein [Pseudomonas sp. TAE6080]MBT9303297.1 phage head morphogenesis protein [Pseudomonas sp. TAE6080]
MTPAQIIQAIEGMEPAMQRAYLEQVKTVVSAATVAEVERLIAEEDEEGLVALLSLGALSAFLELARSVFIAGAKFEVKAIVIPRELGRFEFDVRQPAAEKWVAAKAEEIRANAAIDVRAAIREAMGSRRRIVGWPSAQPVAAQVEVSATPMVRTPRQAALDLLGRVSAQTGSRSGGVIGLPGNYAQYVLNARAQLLGGNPDEMRKYLQRKRRDRRFDGIVNRAIKAGTPVAQADVDKIAGRYAERLMKTYAEMLSKAEALESFGAGRDQVYEQLIAQGLDRDSVTKTWRDRGDKKVRHTHSVMGGQEVQKDQPFQSPTGALLRYPGDTSLGAGWSERANCRCSAIYKIRRK